MNNRWRHLAGQTYLHTFGLAMLIMAATSLGGYLLAESSLSLSLMLPGIIASITLLGIGVLAHTLKRPALAKLVASLLLVLAFYSLLVNLLGQNSDPHRSLSSGLLRMSSPIAVLFILSASGLLCAQTSQRRQSTLCVLAGLIVGLGLMSQLANTFAGLRDWMLAIQIHATSQANLFALLTGAALVCLTTPPAEKQDQLDPVTLATGCLCILMSCVGWQLLIHSNDESIRHSSKLLRDKTKLLLEEASEVKFLAIRRMAARWKSLGGLPTESFWNEETRSFLRDFQAFDTFALLDTTLQAQRLTDRKSVV